MKKIRPIELFLIEFIIYSLLWLWDDYIASLMTVVMTSICFFILIISLITELIEKSKVPRWYYYFMVISVIAPIIVALVFIAFMGADFEWMNFP